MVYQVGDMTLQKMQEVFRGKVNDVIVCQDVLILKLCSQAVNQTELAQLCDLCSSLCHILRRETNDERRESSSLLPFANFKFYIFNF